MDFPVHKRNAPQIAEYFQKACLSPDFLTLCEHAGFQNPTFHSNPHLKNSDTLSIPASTDKFVKGLGELKEETTVCLGLAFHGTKGVNIPSILKNGLDPKRRRGQAYGPGEYFGKDPAVSVSYCHGGLELLVFVVVLPSTLRSNQKKRNGVNDFLVPSDFLVVANNKHHLALGTMKFRAVDPQVLQLSTEKRQQFLSLCKEVHDKSWAAEEGKTKAKIIQYLIGGYHQVDLASELYQKQSTLLAETSKREIAWYVRRIVGEGLADYYFPDLPEPMSLDEMDVHNIRTVDESMIDLSVAVQKLETERPALPPAMPPAMPPPFYPPPVYPPPFGGNYRPPPPPQVVIPYVNQPPFFGSQQSTKKET